MEYKRKRLIRAAWQKAEAKRKQTVRQAESAADTEQQTPEEYAQTVVSEKTAQAAENVQSKALDTGRISYRQFRILQEKRQRVPTTHAAQPAETESPPFAQSADRRESFKRQRFRQKALDKREIKTPDSYRDKMQALKRQHLTRETVRRHLQKQAGGTVLGSGVRLPDTVPAFSGGIRQAALGRIRTLLQAAWLRLKAILTRTIRRAAGSLLALLGAGGVVLLLAMVIGAAAAVIGSPMGILFADESGDPNSIRIAEIVAETNADFGTAINDIVSAHPECSETTMDYDYEDGHTWASYWPEVLAVFAVQNNLNNDGDVVVIDEGKKRLIQDTFWAMHEISAEVEEITATPEPTEDEPDPEPVTEYILHITVSSKSVDALADLYRFTQDQRDILQQLLSEEMRPSLLALCGGIAVADGELCWPLPGHTYISCHFGEVDAFGNAGHRGTDIPAPEGTPILAAHSGAVLVSGWNDSYGNQVLLDNGAGLSTRYAHMTQTAVTAGEAVTAGQVIGYVGSTGDSTGNHLHFEVIQGGVQIDPLRFTFCKPPLQTVADFRGVRGGVVADKQFCVLPIVQQWAGYVMVGKVADHEYLLVVQCAGVGVNLFIVGQQRGVVTVDEGLVRLTQRQQAAVEAVHRFQVAHLFGCVDLRVVGVQRYPRCAGGKACMSRSYLSDRLHREVHSNLTDYVTLTRIQFAANLLRYHHYTITQAAQEVGIPVVPYPPVQAHHRRDAVPLRPVESHRGLRDEPAKKENFAAALSLLAILCSIVL